MIEKNPKYDGLYVFKLDLSKLTSGDVLLTRNAETASFRDKAQSGLIAKATGGSFSHALLCTKPPTFIEAIGHGVSNISAQNCFAHDLKHVRLLRYRDPNMAGRAGSEALPLLGQKYSVRAALRSILPEVRVSDVPDDQLFCSALVAIAFRKAGAPEFAAVDPMKVTPAALERAMYFTDVTSEAFVKILSPSNIEYMSAWDGERAVSPMAGQAELFQSYYQVVSPLFLKFIEETPVLTFEKKPTSFLECVQLIAEASRACEELPDAVGETPRREIKLIDDVASELLADGRMDDMQKAATANDEASLQDTITQSFEATPDINLEDTRGMIVATRQQIASRSSILRDSGLRGRSRVMDKWIEISEEVVGVLNRRLLGLEEVFARVFPTEQI